MKVINIHQGLEEIEKVIDGVELNLEIVFFLIMNTQYRTTKSCIFNLLLDEIIYIAMMFSSYK
jgi:hypothetical protein